MPCNTIRTMQVSIEAMNARAMATALRSLGMADVMVAGSLVRAYDRGTRQTVTVQTGTGGRISLRAGTEALGDDIKQAYAKHMVTVAAKRYGWQVKTVAQNRLTLSRRS